MPMSAAGAAFALPPGTHWSRSYLRSNRNGGKKHLRCFPVHLDDAHNNTRGCHVPLKVRVVGLAIPELTVVVARFHRAEEDDQSAELGLRLGSLQRRSDIAGLLRSRRNPLNPLLAAKWTKPKPKPHRAGRSDPTTAENEVLAGIFTYDLVPEAWHYGCKQHARAAHNIQEACSN